MANLAPILLNEVQSTVQAGSTAIGSATATGINVATGDGANFGTIGTNRYIPAAIADTTGAVKEYVWITSRSTDSLTVIRQAEDSSRFAASTTTIQAGYTIFAVASKAGCYGLITPSWDPRAQGYLTAFSDPNEWMSGNTMTAFAGDYYLTALPVPNVVTVSNIILRVTSVVTSASQCFVGLYDTSGTRIAVSADVSTSFTGTGLKTLALSSAVTVGGGAASIVFGAVIINPNTGGFNLAPNPSLSVLTGSAGGQMRGGRLAGAGATSLPASLTLSSFDVTGYFPWMALS